jgi:hypothetical protein
MATEELSALADGTAPDGSSNGNRAAAVARVSRSLTRLYKEQFGRGPESAHAYS